jgi:hypothetical protein
MSMRPDEPPSPPVARRSGNACCYPYKHEKLPVFARLRRSRAGERARQGPATEPPAKTRLTVTSSAFPNGEAIPPEYTCDGTQKPPPLAWSSVPPRARSIAIFVDDLDAPRGTFTHWLVSGIPPTTTSLSAGALPRGAVAAWPRAS